MNDSANLLHNPAYKAFALSVVALVLNVLFLALNTGRLRGKYKTFINPEDPGFKDGGDHPEVDRCNRAHRNALENFLPYLAIATVYVMLAGATPLGAKVYCGVFAASRWIRSFVYLGGKQPWRTLMFLIGVLCMVGMSVQVLMAAFGH